MTQAIEEAIQEITSRLMSRTPKAAVVLTLRHLSVECDVPYDFLRSVVARENRDDLYSVFALRRGGVGHGARRRYICVPSPLLLRAQRWIHNNILKHARTHSASTAYGPGCSPVRAAEPHCRAAWLIKMDVTNFFDSILEPAVYRAFFDIGYQPLVAFELSRICTRLRKTGNVKRESEENYKISSYDSRHLGHLPQGAPTSPILSNIVSIELDRAIEEKAASFGLRYTRYADDITLSAREKFTRDDAHKVISECYKIMSGFGMWPNRAKTRVIPPGARKIVLGLLVDGDVPRLTREFREEMRTHLHYLERCGAASHAKARKFDSVLGLQNHLFGMAAYGAGVDKQWGRATLRRLAGISWPVRFVMPP